MALTERTQQLIRQHFAGKPLHLAVDATCGNGFDTLFLLQLGFAKIFSFDIQSAAIEASKAKVGSSDKVEFIHDSHAKLASHINSKFDCAMFNLGYLPGAAKHLTTQAKSTIEALEAACQQLDDGGLISIMCYPGHPAGAQEQQHIVAWLNTLAKPFSVETHLASAPKPSAPILYLIKKSACR